MEIEIDSEFSETALEDMAKELEDISGIEQQVRSKIGLSSGPNVIELISKVSKRYQIPPEKRIDFACDAVQYMAIDKGEEAAHNFKAAMAPMEELFNE